MPKRRSDVWYHFTHQDMGRATCNYCKILLSYSGGSTGNLARHLKKRHPALCLDKIVTSGTTAIQELLNFKLEETASTNVADGEPLVEHDSVDIDERLSARRRTLFKTNTAVAELRKLCKTCESSAASKKELEELRIQQMKEIHEVKMKILQTDLKIKEELLNSIRNGTLAVPDAIRYIELHDS